MAWTHDVVVVGAGAAGLTAAGGCARLGLSVALVERGAMGGECLNTGCVPSKALLAAAHRAQAMRGTRLGISGPGPQVDFAAVRAHVRAAIAAIAPHDSAARFAAWGVEVIAGDATLIDRHRVRVGARVLCAPRLVLATGSAPAIPDIPGLTEAPFLTNETVFDIEVLPEHLIVLGGGGVGVELAQAFRRLGATVTLLEGKTLLGDADPDAVQRLRRALQEDGVRLHERATVTAVSAGADGIRVAHGGGVVVGSHLLVATGRTARLAGLGLERAGVSYSAGGIEVDRRRRTTNRAIFAIGDCRAGPRLTHAAGYEGSLVVAAIGFGLPSPARLDRLPSAVYTMPELAQLGLTAAEARARSPRARAATQAFDDNDRAVAEGDVEGFLKLVRIGRRVVGVTIAGTGAGDMLLPWSQVMAGRASLWSLANAIVAYPTRSELSKAVAFAAFEPTLFGSLARWLARGLARLRRLTTRRGGAPGGQ